MHISYVEFVSILCDRLKVRATSMKMYYMCKFDSTMFVLLEDDEEMRKIFRFNDTYCFVYVTSDTNVSVEFIPPPPRYIKFSKTCDYNTTSYNILRFMEYSIIFCMSYFLRSSYT